MVRQTSLDAYNEIKETGLLTKRRLQVYEYIFKNGPVTAQQIQKALGRPFANSSCFMSRVTELHQRGVIESVGEVLNYESNKMVTLWDCTKKLPIKLEKPQKHKCSFCNGTGYIIETQIKMRL